MKTSLAMSLQSNSLGLIPYTLDVLYLSPLMERACNQFFTFTKQTVSKYVKWGKNAFSVGGLLYRYITLLNHTIVKWWLYLGVHEQEVTGAEWTSLTECFLPYFIQLHSVLLLGTCNYINYLHLQWKINPRCEKHENYYYYSLKAFDCII